MVGISFFDGLYPTNMNEGHRRVATILIFPEFGMVSREQNEQPQNQPKSRQNFRTEPVHT